LRICDLIKAQETYEAELGQTVLETVQAMVERNIGAVPVMHNGKLMGIFSERDLMKRVVAIKTVKKEYLTRETRDEWLDRALGDAENSWDFVIARVAIDFRRELRLEDDAVVVSCRLARIGTSSVTTREEIRTAADEVAAEAEAVLVARDPATGESRPLQPDERSALERA